MVKTRGVKFAGEMPVPFELTTKTLPVVAPTGCLLQMRVSLLIMKSGEFTATPLQNFTTVSDALEPLKPDPVMAIG